MADLPPTGDILDALGDDRIYHVYPTFGRAHDVDKRDKCWCGPEIRFETVERVPHDHEIIGAIIVHNIQQ